MRSALAVVTMIIAIKVKITDAITVMSMVILWKSPAAAF
jgi:hypothetical protein